MKETGFENGFTNGEGIVGDDDSSEEEDEEVLDKPKEIIYNKCHLIRQFSPHYKLTSSSCCSMATSNKHFHSAQPSHSLCHLLSNLLMRTSLARLQPLGGKDKTDRIDFPFTSTSSKSA